MLCGRDWPNAGPILVSSASHRQGNRVMVDDRPENTGSPPDSERPKRAPPTIDLTATEVTTEAAPASDAAPSEAAAEATTGIAGRAAACTGVAMGRGAGLRRGCGRARDRRRLDAGLARRSSRLRRRRRSSMRPRSTTSPRASPAWRPKPASPSRLWPIRRPPRAWKLWKNRSPHCAVNSATTRAQSEKLASTINEVKSAAARWRAPAPDLSAIDEHIARIERRCARRRGDRAAGGQDRRDQGGRRQAGRDLPLRRVVAAALLDVLVRIGDPYQAALASAKSLSPNADALKPLDGFAASGVPSAAKLAGELLTLVPKLSPPPPPDTATSGSGIVERLQAGAAKLVKHRAHRHIGNDRGAVVARMTAAALRNDSNEARRELKTLAPADRAAAQAWLDKADARDAALAASRQFATDAMAVLAKPAQ